MFKDLITLVRMLLRPPIRSGAILFCGAILLAACSRQHPADRVLAWQDSFNAGQAEKVLSFYAPDIAYQSTGGYPLRGHEELRDMARYDSVLHAHLSLSQIMVRGDSVFFEADETNEWFRRAGVDVLHERGVIVLQNGLMSYLHLEITPESHQAVHTAFYTIVGWASRERPDELAKLVPGGRYLYTAESAAGWVELLKSWKAAPAVSGQ